MDNVLTVPEIAKHLRVHRDTVVALIRGGRLKAIRLPGRGYRIERKDFDDYLKEAKRT